MKLGILKGSGPIHENGILELFVEDTASEYCFADSYAEETL